MAGDEIWLAGGEGDGLQYIASETFVPNKDASKGVNDNDPEDDFTFVLVDGVAILGGFAGVGSADPDERDVERRASVLSGDNVSDHVVVANGVGPTTTLRRYYHFEGRVQPSVTAEDGQGIFIYNNYLTGNV